MYNYEIEGEFLPKGSVLETNAIMSFSYKIKTETEMSFDYTGVEPGNYIWNLSFSRTDFEGHDISFEVEVLPEIELYPISYSGYLYTYNPETVYEGDEFGFGITVVPDYNISDDYGYNFDPIELECRFITELNYQNGDQKSITVTEFIEITGESRRAYFTVEDKHTRNLESIEKITIEVLTSDNTMVFQLDVENEEFPQVTTNLNEVQTSSSNRNTIGYIIMFLLILTLSFAIYPAQKFLRNTRDVNREPLPPGLEVTGGESSVRSYTVQKILCKSCGTTNIIDNSYCLECGTFIAK
jgi:hypothetical protein